MPINSSTSRIALVHDWLVAYRGGEKVLDAICELFPTADLFTLICQESSIQGAAQQHKITASWLNRLPWVHRYYRKLLPLMPMAIESLDLAGYDLVISTSHCVAKGALASPSAIHLCYCFTPARYVWDRQQDYFKSPALQMAAQPILHYLRQWDTVSAQRVDSFAVISSWVGQRIRRYYDRESTVIHPWVDLNAFQSVPGDRAPYFLVVSALVPYKRIDMAIKACKRLNKRLVVIGHGPEERRLKRLADGHDVQFLGHASQDQLCEAYASAQALLFPGDEDFGIVPLEAMACGTPIIALGHGGVLDTVIDGETGLLFPDQTVESLTQAILRFEKTKASLSRLACRSRASLFSRKAFQENFLRFVTASNIAPSLLSPRSTQTDENTL